MSNAFEIKLEQGKVGEDLISRWLIGRGWNILPVYEKVLNDGKGPRVYSADSNLVAPDALAFKDTRFIWIEAKTKSRFTYHRITGKYETGIDLRHYLDYIKVSEKSNVPLYLFFLHTGSFMSEDPMENETGLFCGEIKKLMQCENHRSDNWGRTGMVYWAKESLIKVATFEQVCPATLSF